MVFVGTDASRVTLLSRLKKCSRTPHSSPLLSSIS